MTTSTLLISLAGAFVPLALIVGAGTLLGGRLVGLHREVRPALGLCGLGVVALLVLWGTYAAPALGAAIAFGAVIAALAVLILLRCWQHWRTWVPVLVVSCGALVLTAGLLGAAPVGEDAFRSAATRFLPWDLPEDNRLPSLLATWFAGPRADGYLIGDWLPSDRPPLQAGIILLVRALAGVWPGEVDAVVLDFAGSACAQIAWVPSVVCLVLVLGARERAAVAAAAFTALVPVTVLNTAYTWPKLLSGAFVAAALAVLASALRAKSEKGVSLVLAAAASALGLLAHGGAAFMLPAILVLAAVLLVRMDTWRRRFAWAGVAAAAVLLLYGPWLLYQRLIAPPGDRLLKWHLAGVVPIDDRSFFDDLIRQYQDLGWAQAVAHRVSNLGHAFDVDLLQGLDLWNEGALARRLSAEFYQTSVALALGVLPLLVLVVHSVVMRIRGRRLPTDTRWSLLVAILATCCVVVWALLMFQPDGAIVHQGSHAWMLVLLAVPFAWLADHARIVAAVTALCQLSLTLILLGRDVQDPSRQANLTVVALAVLLLVGGTVIAAGGGRQPEAATGDCRESLARDR